jgi:hypothetical protein
MTRDKKMVKSTIKTGAKRGFDSLMIALSNGTFAFVFNKSSYPRVGARKLPALPKVVIAEIEGQTLAANLAAGTMAKRADEHELR